MTVKHLDHLNLSVRSFDETATWYGLVFGFEVVEKGLWKGTPWGIIRSGEAMLCIYEHPEYRPADEGEEGRHHINHFGLRVTDRKTWESTVQREGLEVLYGGPVRWPHSTSWYVKDPSGYEIEVALWDEEVVRFDTVSLAAGVK